MLSANSDSFSSFLVWIPFISFSSLIAIARISRTMLHNSGENGHPFLVHDLRRNAFSFSPLRIMFAIGLSYMAFLCWGRFLLCPFVWRVLLTNGCWILSKVFSASMEIIIWCLSFNLFMWCITLIDLQILKNHCILGIKLTWSWCMIFLICCWILFARIFLRIFASMFISDVSL